MKEEERKRKKDEEQDRTHPASTFTPLLLTSQNVEKTWCKV